MSEDFGRIVFIVVFSSFYLITLILLWKAFSLINAQIEKAIKLGNHYVDTIKSNSGLVNTLRPDYNNTRTYVPAVAEIRDVKVEQLAPETIAPALKKPPKPAGGFGSKVSTESNNQK